VADKVDLLVGEKVFARPRKMRIFPDDYQIRQARAARAAASGITQSGDQELT